MYTTYFNNSGGRCVLCRVCAFGKVRRSAQSNHRCQPTFPHRRGQSAAGGGGDETLCGRKIRPETIPRETTNKQTTLHNYIRFSRTQKKKKGIVISVLVCEYQKGKCNDSIEIERNNQSEKCITYWQSVQTERVGRNNNKQTEKVWDTK